MTPDWGTVLTTWRTTWGVEVVATALAALYLRTAFHVGGWPVARTVSSVGALVIAVVAVDSGIGQYAPRSYSVGAVLQLLLTTVVPALWVGGRPVDLLRRGSPGRPSDVLDRLRTGAAARLLTAPVTVLVVLALVLVTSRVTAVRAAAATSPLLAVAGPVLALGAGLLVLHAAVGLSPARRIPLLGAATGLTVLAGLLPPAAGLVPTFSPEDVALGGTITWAAGGGVLLGITIAAGVRRAVRGPGTDGRLHGSGRCPVC